MKVTLSEKKPKRYLVYIPYVHLFKVTAINESQAIRKAKEKGEGRIADSLDSQIIVTEI